MEAREKSKIINSIFLNLFIVFLAVIIYFVYVNDLNNEAINNKNNATSLSSYLYRITDKGPTFDELKIIMENHDTSDLVLGYFDKKEEIEEVIHNDSGKDYLTWLDEERLKNDEYEEVVDKDEELIGNILPVFYQLSGESSFFDSSKESSEGEYIKQQITLQTFINFIETDLLKRFNIKSFSDIGINEVNFGGNSEGITQSEYKNIGSFSLQLSFEGKNNNILAMINNIQNSGKLKIEDGKLVPIEVIENGGINKDNTFSDLDNLLITVESLNLKHIPTEPLPEGVEFNKGDIELMFYVRGITPEQFNLIKIKIFETYTDLKNKITPLVGICDSPKGSMKDICEKEDIVDATGTIRSLFRRLKMIGERIEEKNRVNFKSGTEDVNAIMNEWNNIYNTLKSISDTYEPVGNTLEDAINNAK